MADNKKFCPFDKTGTLACDMIYRFDELQRQLQYHLDKGVPYIKYFGGADCECETSLCPRFTEFQASPKKQQPKVAHACPYDGDFCDKKRLRFQKWAEAVEWHAKNRVSNTFYTGPDMFDKCPLAESQMIKCQRYKRYLYIVDNVKQNAK